MNADPELRWQLRPMTVRDLSAVTRVEQASYPNPWPESFFGRCLEGGCDAWILQMDNRVEGYFIVQFASYGAHLLNLCVDPGVRGLGLGKYMLTQALERSRSRANVMILEVRPSNAAAIGLYERVGFRKLGLKKDYYKDPDRVEDALVMACPL